MFAWVYDALLILSGVSVFPQLILELNIQSNGSVTDNLSWQLEESGYSHFRSVLILNFVSNHVLYKRLRLQLVLGLGCTLTPNNLPFKGLI